MIYNNKGILVNKKAIKVNRLIDSETKKLFKLLFKEGMTFIESKALLDHLYGSIRLASTIELLKSRCK